MNPIRAFLKDPSGGTAIEYALVAAGMSLAVLSAINTTGGQLTGLFENVQSRFDEVAGQGSPGAEDNARQPNSNPGRGLGRDRSL